MMALDLRMFYRVIVKPGSVFEVFLCRPHLEALVPVVLIGVLHAIRFDLDPSRSDALASFTLVVGVSMAFAYSVILMLSFPLVSAIYVFLLRNRLGNNSAITFGSVFTALVLCALPVYFGSLLTSFSSSAQLGLGNLFPRLIETHPFLHGVLTTLTPYFIWTAVLWWIALTVLLRPGARQRVILLASLVLLNVLIGGALGEGLALILKDPALPPAAATLPGGTHVVL